MGHDRGVDAVEGPPAREDLLAGRVLLRGSGLEDDPPRQPAVELAVDGREREEGADRLGAHDVVAAAVPDARQGVVLAEDGHGGGAGVIDRADLGAQGGRQVEDAVLVVDAVALQKGPDGRHGVVLVPPGLGMVVDVVGQPDQLGAEPLEQSAEALMPAERRALAGVEGRRCGQGRGPLPRLGAHVLDVGPRRNGRPSRPDAHDRTSRARVGGWGLIEAEPGSSMTHSFVAD